MIKNILLGILLADLVYRLCKYGPNEYEWISTRLKHQVKKDWRYPYNCDLLNLKRTPRENNGAIPIKLGVLPTDWFNYTLDGGKTWHSIEMPEHGVSLSIALPPNQDTTLVQWKCPNPNDWHIVDVGMCKYINGVG